MAKQSLREKLLDKQKKLKEKGQGGSMIFFKEGVTRWRPVPVGDGESDWGFEVMYVYLNKELGGYISPKTFGGKDAYIEEWEQMKGAKDEDDRAFAKKMAPKKRYLVAGVKYKDEKGQEIDEEMGVKLALCSGGLYNEMIDLFLDEDDAGDFTDPIKGYDLKTKRSGKGQFDTEYHIMKCKPSKLPKKFRGPYNLEEMIKAVIPTYKQTKEYLEKFLGGSAEEEETVVKKKKKKKSPKGDL